MRSGRMTYLIGAAAVAASHAAGGAAGFLSFWLLARILTKEMFGGYVFATAVVALLGFIATLGLDRSLLLRIAGLRERAAYLHGGGIAWRTSLIAVLVGGVFGVALTLGAPAFVRMGAIPEAAFWLPALSIAIPPIAATLTLQAWYKANHRVPVAVVIPGLTDLLRALFFTVVFVAGLGAWGVAASVSLSAAIPAALLVLLAWGKTRSAPRRLTGGDLTKGFQFLTMRISTEGMRKLDLVMMGLLSTGAATAEYAVAARLAVLADYARNALKSSYTPRARRWLIIGEVAAAWREYEHTRCACLAGALAAAAALVVLGLPVLRFFGPFEAAYAPLLILTASYVVTAGFGMHATYLAMAGEVGWSAIVRIAALTLFIALNLVLIPRLGAVGAAITGLTIQVFLNVAGAALAYRLTGLKPVDPPILLVLALANATLVLVAFGEVSPVAGAAVLMLATIVPLARSRTLILNIASLLMNRLLPRA